MSDTRWDAVVIGAGPAGSIAARQLALAGARVLLVDRAVFPRPKVCGCCVNESAVGTLREMGLGGVLERLALAPIRRLELRAGSACATLSLGGGIAVARAALDAALVEEAVARGVRFRDGASATLAPTSSQGPRMVSLLDKAAQRELTADLVLVADGLSGRSLSELPEFAWHVQPSSRIGFGAVVHWDALPRGTVRMCCGRRGYIGAVALNDGLANIAAAMDLAFVQAHGGPGPAAASLLREAGVEPPDVAAAPWKGTPALSRRRGIESERILVIGDAAGYMEPFTGEGMNWAISGAWAAAKCGLRILQGTYDPGDWTRRHGRLIARRQTACRLIAMTLRRPHVTRAAVRLLAAAPILAFPMLRTTGASGATDARPA
jgi:menaquinone-9 beta-reductase